MKKIIVSVFILCSLVFGGIFKVEAITLNEALQQIQSLKTQIASLQKSLLGQAYVEEIEDVPPVAVLDPTPRIMYWWGKVNQHVDAQGNWLTDPDGTSGASIDKLTYCKKWFPNTTSVEPYKKETVTWRAVNNTGAYPYEQTSDKCVQGTQALSLTVLSPKGGEIYQTGQQIVVNWKSTGYGSGSTLEINLAKKDANGNSNTFLMTKSGLSDDGTETLTIPTTVPTASHYLIHLSIYDPVTTRWQTATSTNPFTIQAPAASACVINSLVVNPTVVEMGQSYTVTWKTSGCSLVGLGWDGPNGAAHGGTNNVVNGSVAQIADDIGINNVTLSASAPGSDTLVKKTISFTVIPAKVSLDPTPRIALWYGKVNQHTDEKGNWFTDPDGVSGAGSYSQWGSEGYGDRKLEYCRKWYPNTTSVEPYKTETIATWRAKYNTGEYSYAVVTDKCVQGTVVGKPSVKVVSPNGGEAFTDGQKITVKWESSNLPTSTVINISLVGYNNNAEMIMYTGMAIKTANDGSEVVTLPKIPTYYPGFNFGKFYKIEITDNGMGHSDMSDNLFTIKSATAIEEKPSIKVLSPNGGEVYDAGQTITVKWETKNHVGTISAISLIPLDMQYGTGMTYDKNIPNTGSYTLTLPKEADRYSFGKNFKIEAEIITSAYEISDVSDDAFTINSLNNETPKITLISPMAGSTLEAGKQVEVRWKSNIPATDTLLVTTRFNGKEISKFRTLNDGYEIIKIPQNTQAGMYAVEVSNYSSGTKYVYGSATFNVISQYVSPTFCVPSSVNPCVGDTTITPVVKFAKTLKVGLKDDDVKALQLKLTEEGVFTAVPTGYYGPATREAVKRYQIKYGLPAVGAVGPKTLELLNK